MRKLFLFVSVLLSVGAVFTACNKPDDFKPLTHNDFFPLQKGKYIIYDVDSFLVVSFGQKDTTIKGQAKYVTDSSFTDNSGRKTYIIGMYYRRNAASPWVYENTFSATSTATAIEFTENNLRFIKLSSPVKEDFSWKGNSYLPAVPYPTYGFSLFNAFDWDYTYANVLQPYTVNSKTYDSACVVNEEDSYDGDSTNIKRVYSRVFSQSAYAANIGMIYRNLYIKEHQPGMTVTPIPNTSPQRYDTSFKPYNIGVGVTMRINSHN